MKVFAILASFLFSSFCVGGTTPSRYGCEIVTQKGSRQIKSFSLKRGLEAVEQEFTNPVSEAKEKAILFVPKGSQQGDGLKLEIQVWASSRWQPLARVLIAGNVRSALLEDADHNYVTCTSQR